MPRTGKDRPKSLSRSMRRSIGAVLAHATLARHVHVRKNVALMRSISDAQKSIHNRTVLDV